MVDDKVPRKNIEVNVVKDFYHLYRGEAYEAIITQLGHVVTVIILDGTEKSDNVELERFVFNIEGKVIKNDNLMTVKDVKSNIDLKVSLSGFVNTNGKPGLSASSVGKLVLKEDGEEAVTLVFQP